MAFCKNINFNNTLKAYRVFSTTELIQQKRIYQACNLLSYNEYLGHKLVNKFMDIKPYVVYPKIEEMMFNQFCGGEDLSTMIPMLDELQKEQITPLKDD